MIQPTVKTVGYCRSPLPRLSFVKIRAIRVKKLRVFANSAAGNGSAITYHFSFFFDFGSFAACLLAELEAARPGRAKVCGSAFRRPITGVSRSRLKAELQTRTVPSARLRLPFQSGLDKRARNSRGVMI